jgi:hypothetical protein
MIISPPEIPIIPISVGEWFFFIVEQWLFLQKRVITRCLSKLPRIAHPREEERGRKLESIHWESTQNLRHQQTIFHFSAINTRKFIADSTTTKECAKQNAFQTRKIKFSDGAWCLERFHDRPFQDFVAHETHCLILFKPRFS